MPNLTLIHISTVDSSAVMAALSASMKQDNSVLSSSLAIQAAAMLPNKEGFEDLLAIADIEVCLVVLINQYSIRYILIVHSKKLLSNK